MTSRRMFFSTLAAAGFAPLAAETAKRGMRVLSTRPEDFEMPMEGFLSEVTPIEQFFVRSHHYTPKVDLASWRLAVEGEVGRTLSLSMDDLRKLPRVELVSVIECAGNGRSLYEPSIIGLQWEHGGVGNGRWAGVRLADVLKQAGLKPTARHILFDGADVPVGTMPKFQRTVPTAKALHPDTLLAYEMNGQALPVSHGFPLRLVVPGWGGDCWTKWVTRIQALDRDFEGFFMATGYRHPGKAVVPGTAVDPKLMKPVESLHIKSVIAAPLEGAVLGTGPVTISGAAWSGDSPVASVEVSTDRGRTWKPARLSAALSRYSWRTFQLAWTPPEQGHYVLMARARDAAGNTQPFAPEWNPSGYLWNVVHQVPVEVAAAASAPKAPAAPATGTPNARYKAACIGCHEEDVIAQQRLTRAQWDRELTKMKNWGASVPDDARNELLDYLTSRFGYRPRR